MAEYLFNQEQSVLLNQAAIFENSIPCNRGYVLHENQSGIFTLRGIVNNPTACFARYEVTFNGNIALTEGSTVTPIAVALAVQGETRPTSRAIFTPAAVEQYGNVTSTATVTVPRGCCFTVSLRAVPGSDDPTVTPAPVISLINANLRITRTA